MLEINDVSVASRLRQLSVQIASGQLVGVIGPNGAGKSTLLQLLAGVTRSSAGWIEFNHINIDKCSAHRRRQLLSYLPQYSKFSEPVTTCDLLKLSQINLQATPQQLKDWRLSAVAQFQLDTLCERSVTELSGGEQRRVAIACMACSNRPLMLLDEPVSGLDLYHQLNTMDWLKGCAKQGATVIIAIHDLALAAQYCDYLLLLNKGQQVAFGSPSEVLSDTNLASTFQVSVDWLCHAKGVAMLTRRLGN